MKRPLLIIAMFLLLGAVVNVAVAWGCAIWSPLRLDFLIGGPFERTDALAWHTMRAKRRGALLLTNFRKPERFPGRTTQISINRPEGRISFFKRNDCSQPAPPPYACGQVEKMEEAGDKPVILVPVILVVVSLERER